MKKLRLFVGLLLIAGISTSCANSSEYQLKTYNKARTLDNFDDYVNFLKNKAKQAGISSQFLAKQNDIFYIDKAVELDQRQSSKKPHSTLPPRPNPDGITHYLKRVLTQKKVNKAVDLWWEYQPQLTKASKKYNVPKEYLMALWRMESSFGYYQGNYDVLSVLATLSFDGRREKLFTQEFINAMKILENKTISRLKMKGSWAGAMGQSQFMPTTYLHYAVDGNNDGQKDIWSEPYDVFASIASYISSMGWDNTLPWGIEVELSLPIDLALSGVQKKKAKKLSQWVDLGINIIKLDDMNLIKLDQLSDTDLWLVLPNKEVGRAFLVSNNYRVLKRWNNSNYFAVSIGQFAEKIAAEVY
ncbi:MULTISPECIES: lytic murein transglycosylase [Pasteurellaceae]|uniref:Lytic murein transglycosylase n=1 Tax=Pasteurella atlantica TaxID=2827233 RepID=A0AAW8CJQ1_9PAST|nr:lytic murein transglycosylase [Pasteurella atlantica]MBR0573275.1 lytic murein transglycosylase [Pasteurella atlantica]MDP8039109.1 lytic murein transglycosylase [Pasteurella atlantica]MDP8041292.1 lytic murein transglycosylase [Pasteurella atlantica]MDP8043429.1 lytic murein transglycosylase [Pasteurella atlantica]MDP8045515.1 lytic murein transglycosylase [Pasteurella atlantica]